MIYFLKQKFNPNRHEKMPLDFPWQVQGETPTGDDWDSFTSEEDFNSYVNSFDLSEYNSAILSEENAIRQNVQRLFGEEISPLLIDKMGARNLDLIAKGISVNITSLASDNSSVKLLIETGALGTATSIMGNLKIKYPDHADLYEWALTEINAFLFSRGYK